MENEENRKTRIIAQTMIAAKKDQGIYQQDVARLLGVSPSTLSRWLRGRVPVPEGFREMILSILQGPKKFKRGARCKPQPVRVEESLP